MHLIIYRETFMSIAQRILQIEEDMCIEFSVSLCFFPIDIFVDVVVRMSILNVCLG